MRQSDLVYAELRRDIVDWRIQPGRALNETELTERFNVSRTPVREALQRLAREGLVNLSHGRGAAVSEISLDDLAQLVQMRDALETYAVRMCARRPDRAVFDLLYEELAGCADDIRHHRVDDHYEHYYDLITRFDQAIAEGTDNHYLISALDDLRGHLYRLRRTARRRPERIAATTDEHLAICQAIRDGDEGRAVVETSRHIRHSFQAVLATLMHGVVGPVLEPPAAPETDRDRVGKARA